MPGARRGAAPAAAPAVATADTTKKGAATPAAPAQVAVDTSGAAAASVPQAGHVFPREKLPEWTIPKTPTPAGLTFNTALVGNADRGLKLLSTGGGGCVGCHLIRGDPLMHGS